jgi:hypothetical protein
MRNLRRATKIIDALRTRWGKRAYVSTIGLSRTLNKEFKSLGVVIRFEVAKPDSDRKLGYAWHIVAWYDPRMPGVEPTSPLYEVVVRREKVSPKFMVNKWFWNELLLVLAHEFKHADQRRKRKGRIRIREERKNLNSRADVYYCQFDEIDAHAFETALEWKIRGGNFMELPTVKRYYKKTRRWAMPEWRRFVKRVHKYSHQLV